jgi:hypothetical protein
LRSIYNLNNTSKNLTDLDSKKRAFEQFDKIKPSHRTLAKKSSLSDDDLDVDAEANDNDLNVSNGSRYQYYMFHLKHNTSGVGVLIKYILCEFHQNKKF